MGECFVELVGGEPSDEGESYGEDDGCGERWVVVVELGFFCWAGHIS